MADQLLLTHPLVVLVALFNALIRFFFQSSGDFSTAGSLLVGTWFTHLFMRSFTHASSVNAVTVAGSSLGPGHTRSKGIGIAFRESTVE